MKTNIKQLNPVSDTKRKAAMFALKIFISVLLLAGLMIGTWGIARSNDGKIYSRVTINGIKVGGLTPEEAKYILDQYITKINSNGPTIVYEESKFNPKLTDLGVTFNTQKAVDEAYSLGRDKSIVKKVQENALLTFKNFDVALNPSIDEEKLDNYLNSMAKVIEQEPIDATLKYENGIWIVQTSEIGEGFDKKYLQKSINIWIKSHESQGEIVLETTELKPEIDEQEATAAIPEAEKLLEAAPIKISYEDGKKEYSVEKSEIASWVAFVATDDILNPEISNKKIEGYVNWIASKIEVAKIDKEIMDGTGEVLKEGQDGLTIDKNKLINELKYTVANGIKDANIKIITNKVEKNTVTIYPSAQPGRYSGRYIDVNLTEQKLYAFDGKNQVNSFLISSGKRGYNTPTGEFSVWTKVRSQVMDGPDFYLPNVQWVSYFNGEIGIHGAYWHNNFGHPMSHGCINARNGDAEWVYNFVEVGTPVYVHY